MDKVHFPSIEIIERTSRDLKEESALVPTEIRVDGVLWAVSGDHPVTISGVEFPTDRSVCMVTFTVLARRVRIDSQTIEPGEPR